MRLDGPTSFAPAVRQSIELLRAAARGPSGTGLVDRRRMDFTLCLIICDGCVDGEGPRRATEAALAEASNFPISVICIGVGDGNPADPLGPWATLRRFDDDMHEGHGLKFDIFKFICFSELLEEAAETGRSVQDLFACSVLDELPEQVQACTDMKLYFPKLQ